MLDGLDLDPYTVLGIGRDADPSQIQEAFRRKSKKHHPDLGGDEWAFRIVVRAYELLNNRLPAAPPRWPVARPYPDVVFRVEEPEDFEPGEAPGRDWAAETERIRPGVKDRDFEPARIVLVEVLWLRMEVSDIYALLDRREGSSFSGSLHLRWPDPEAGLEGPTDPATLHEVLGALTECFDLIRSRPGVLNARSRTERGRFEAWLSYSSGQDAWKAFTKLRPELNQRGLGVRQLTRDMTIPRDVNGA